MSYASREDPKGLELLGLEQFFLCPLPPGDVARECTVELPAAKAEVRITSYNVCYTKLLRKGKGKMTLETRHRTKDGRILPVEVMANYLSFGGREFDCAFARDITRRKRNNFV